MMVQANTFLPLWFAPTVVLVVLTLPAAFWTWSVLVDSRADKRDHLWWIPRIAGGLGWLAAGAVIFLMFLGIGFNAMNQGLALTGARPLNRAAYIHAMLTGEIQVER